MIMEDASAETRPRLHWRLIISLAMAALVVGCASAPVYNPGDVPADKMKQVAEACAEVARLPNGSYYDYYVCEEALSRSLASHLRSEQLLVSRKACLAKGMRAGAASLSDCELHAQPNMAALDVKSPPQTSPVTDGVKPADRSPRADLREREQYACADIGYDPVDPAFGQCVADLDAELFAADRPIR